MLFVHSTVYTFSRSKYTKETHLVQEVQESFFKTAEEQEDAGCLSTINKVETKCHPHVTLPFYQKIKSVTFLSFF